MPSITALNVSDIMILVRYLSQKGRALLAHSLPCRNRKKRKNTGCLVPPLR
jgi:hypothetical protein